MGKLWMQAYGNIRKTKSVSITLGALFLIAALLINTGLLVFFNYGSFFKDVKKELNASDAYFYLPDSLYNDQSLNYIENNEHVKKTQINDMIVTEVEFKYQDKNTSFNVGFFNMNDDREMSKWQYVGEHETADDMSIYVPDLLKAVSGYEINDKITLKYKDEVTKEKKALTFTIKGYTEDIYYSSVDTGIMGFYLPEQTYKNVSNILNHKNNKAHIVFVNVDDVANVSKIEDGLRETLGLDSASMIAGDSSQMIFSIDISLIEMARCMMPKMIAGMMVLFATIIVIVCLLVVWFRIVNSLEDDIMKIGSLKSIGYTNKQITSSILMQFCLIAGIGSIAGIGLTYPLLPSISKIFEQQSGLKWSQGFDLGISLITIFAIIAVVILVINIAARRVRKLTPVLALRGETTTKSFKKNRYPLEKTKGNLSFVLALKSTIQNMKHNIMIIVILIAVVFAGAYGVIMYYNTSIDTTAFAMVPGMEITNVVVALDNKKDTTEVVNKIKNMDKVKKVAFVDESKYKIDGTQASAIIMDDFSKKNSNFVYEGHYPNKPGEIVLAGVLSERLNKKIGDYVTVKYSDNELKLKVVGLSNGSSMGGINSSIQLREYKKLNPDFKQQLLYVYLDKGTNTADFIKKIESTINKEDYVGITNFDKELEEGMLAYQVVVAAMGVSMAIITLFVITLVLYFIISSSIVRKKKELGIKKAVGFTTLQLMNQVSISFVFPIFIGTIVGSILGALLTNPFMSLVMKSMGIMKSNFIINPLWVILFGVFVLAFSYILALLITWRIRKISAYALVTE